MNNKKRNRKMKHTKGKWKLDKSGVATAIKSGDVFVASIYNRDKRIKGDGITEVWGNDAYDTSETDANASLIASAPEMLRIIKDVVIIEKKLGHDGSSVFWRCEDFLSKIKKTNKKGEIK
jgi:hypothetical protein